MNLLIGAFSFIFASSTIFIVDFTSESDPTNWFMVDDVVMGAGQRVNFFSTMMAMPFSQAKYHCRIK